MSTAVTAALKQVHTALHANNEGLDAAIGGLKAALVEAGQKSVEMQKDGLPQNNRQGRKMLQTYFKKRGVLVTFPGGMIKALPQSLNTHHLWKLVALVFMTVDHVGAFWFPDELWWRAVGRVFVPIWFFLVGHALRYEPTRDTLLWAVVLAALNPFLGMPLFPLNTLVTILIIQWVLARVEAGNLLARNPLVLALLAVLFLIPSLILTEYGTLGLLFALLGYAKRSGQMDVLRGGLMAVAAFGLYVAVMLATFAFTYSQQLVVIAGTALVTMGFACFVHRPVAAPETVAKKLRFLAQHSMQYYVIHRVLMQAVALCRGTFVYGLRWI